MEPIYMAISPRVECLNALVVVVQVHCGLIREDMSA
jgi:hypothetical protein